MTSRHGQPPRPDHTERQRRDDTPARVLIVDSDRAERAAIAAVCRKRSIRFRGVSTLAAAYSALADESFDAVAVGLTLSDGSGLDLVRGIRSSGRATSSVVLAHQPRVDDAVETLRAGAVDIVSTPLDADDLYRSLRAAIDISRRERGRNRRVKRLKRAVKRASGQVDVLCNDLLSAYRDLADKVTNMTISTEFSAVIRQELDLEELLRSALEFLLARTGPTNVAVYLPSNHCDFSLGAYVNYDCPRDAAEVLLEHLADVFAPRFQDQEDVVHIEGSDQLANWIGDDANWLADSGVMVCSCRHDDECLAVLTLFRDRNEPFSEDLPAQLKVMGGLLGEQLARVIKVHHRHQPADVDAHIWEEDESTGDDFGLAA